MKVNIICVTFIMLIGYIDVSSATITGVPPNTTGNTIIDVNTTWDNINVTLGGNILIGNATRRIFVNFTNSKVFSSNRIDVNLYNSDHDAYNEGVNLTIANTTITFNVTSGKNVTVPIPGKIDHGKVLRIHVNRYHKPSRIEIRNSTIQGTNKSLLAYGLDIESGGLWGGCCQQAEHTIIIVDSLFQYLGALSSEDGIAYCAIDGGYKHAIGSYFSNVTLNHSNYGICLESTDSTPVNRATAYYGAVVFKGGKDWNNSYMHKSYEGVYDPSNNAWIRNGWYDAGETKFDIMGSSNTIFENNTVINAAFNLGDGAGNNNTARNNIFINTGVWALKNFIKIINNTFQGGFSGGGDVAINVQGNNYLVDGNHINGGVDGIIVQTYTEYWDTRGNHIIKNNYINHSAYRGIYVNQEFNNTIINNTINGTLYTDGGGIWIKNSTTQLFIDTKIYNIPLIPYPNRYYIKLQGGLYYTSKLDYKFINTMFDDNGLKIYTGAYFNNYYYSDVNVINSDGNSISLANVTIINLNDSIFQPINIMGLNRTSFMTGTDGHTYLPIGNESISIALLAYWQNSTTRQNMSYLISVFDPNHLYTSTPTLIYPNGTLLQLSPLATATVSPNSFWYRPNPNTYQNTTVITIDRARTNISLGFPNGSITVSNATQTSVDATSAADQSYILFNNSVPVYANRDVNFTVNGVIYANRTADASGFVSFNYTKFIASGSSHVFKWVANTSKYDVNKDGVVDIYDLIIIGNNPDQSNPLPYPEYDVDENGQVDLNDYLDVLFYLKSLNI